MYLRDLVIGTLIVCGILIGLSSFTADLYSNYGVTGSEDTSTLGNHTYDLINGTISSLDENIKGTDVEDTSGGEFDILVGSYNAFKTILGVPAILKGMIGGVFILFAGWGIPTWVSGIIFAIITAFVIFEVLSGLLKYKI